MSDDDNKKKKRTYTENAVHQVGKAIVEPLVRAADGDVVGVVGSTLIDAPIRIIKAITGTGRDD